MRSIISMLAVTGLAMIICLISCSDKTTIVQNVYPDDQVTVAGNLLAWYCWVGDCINNRYNDLRFGVETKDTARIIIVYSNDWRDTIYTDTLSHFERIVGKGLHQFIVETRYTRPDTFQVYLDRDTAMDLKIAYDIAKPDTVEIVFIYDNATDTLGVSQEWNALRRLNDRLNGALSTYGTEPVLAWRREYLISKLYVSWIVPLSSRKLNALAISDLAQEVLASDTAHTISSIPIEAWAYGGYGCMH